MEKFNQACELMKTNDIFTLRKAIELFEQSEVEGARDNIELCKAQIHMLYEAKKKKKLRKKIIALGIVALIILIGVIIYSNFMGKIRARELEIYKKFDGLTFYGELHTTDVDDNDVVWKVDEQTTFVFDGDKINHHYIRAIEPQSIPENCEADKDTLIPQRAELDIPIYKYEVFINTKGDVFLHLEHYLFPVIVDENDNPYEIQKYNGKTLKIKK